MERTTSIYGNGNRFPWPRNKRGGPRQYTGIAELVHIIRDFKADIQTERGIFVGYQYHYMVIAKKTADNIDGRECIRSYIQARRRLLGCKSCEDYKEGHCKKCGCRIHAKEICTPYHLENVFKYLANKAPRRTPDLIDPGDSGIQETTREELGSDVQQEQMDDMESVRKRSKFAPPGSCRVLSRNTRTGKYEENNNRNDHKSNNPGPWSALQRTLGLDNNKENGLGRGRKTNRQQYSEYTKNKRDSTEPGILATGNENTRTRPNETSVVPSQQDMASIDWASWEEEGPNILGSTKQRKVDDGCNNISSNSG